MQSKMDFDTLLPMIGDFHRYQLILFALLCFPFCFYITFVYFAQIFITLEPPHWCLVPQLVEAGFAPDLRKELSVPLEVKDGRTHYSSCLMYDIDYQQLLDNLTSAWNQSVVSVDKNRWNVKSCTNGWEYDHQEIYPTVVSEWDWVCDDNWRGPFAQSMFFVGCVIGCVIFGLVSDWLGRIPALMMTNLLACAAGVATAFSQGFVTFTIFRFLMGMTFDTCFMVYYILVLEYVGPSKRTFVSNVSFGIFYCLSTASIPWLAYVIADWRTFAIVTSAPMGAVILLWRVLPESARWLITKGRIEEASKIVERIAKINKKELKTDVLSSFQNTTTLGSANTAKLTLIDLFKKPVLRRRTLILFLLWFIIALVYDGHARNTHNLGYSIFFSFSIASATELPAAILILLLLDRIGRRWLSLLSLLLGGIVSLCFVAVPEDLQWLGLVLAMIGRLFTNIAFNIGLQYATELIPTVVRGQGMAAAHLLGFVANILSPFVVYLALYSHALPLIVFGILSVLGGVLALFLPETLDQNLPETLEDGENFGVDQPFCLFPCCIKTSSKADTSSDDVEFQNSIPSANTENSITRF